MSIFKSIKIKKYLKKIEPDVDKELIKMGLLTIVNGKKNYKMGTCHVKWQIQKKLMKERFNIDWKSPQEKIQILCLIKETLNNHNFDHNKSL